jgi:hypothetical protein
MATNVNFSLLPGMATTNVIDYTTTAGQKLWNNATDKLSVELFDCESEGLRDFLELIRARSEVMGWSLSVLSIPVDVNDNLGDTQDFLSHYGEINLGHCREHALTYYNQQTQAAQDSMMLYTCPEFPVLYWSQQDYRILQPVHHQRYPSRHSLTQGYCT